MTVSRAEIKEILGQMPVMDLVELISELESEWGVSSVAPIPVAVAPGASDSGAGVEEKTEFDVVMTSFGDNKVSVIKTVRAITSIGLKEAKELVEGTPAVIKGSVDKEEAEKIKQQMEEAGAKVELK